MVITRWRNTNAKLNEKTPETKFLGESVEKIEKSKKSRFDGVPTRQEKTVVNNFETGILRSGMAITGKAESSPLVLWNFDFQPIRKPVSKS